MNGTSQAQDQPPARLAMLGTASAEDRVLIKLPRVGQAVPCTPTAAASSTTLTCEHQAGILQLLLWNLEAEGLVVEGIYGAPHAGGLLGFC